MSLSVRLQDDKLALQLKNLARKYPWFKDICEPKKDFEKNVLTKFLSKKDFVKNLAKRICQ